MLLLCQDEYALLHVGLENALMGNIKNITVH